MSKPNGILAMNPEKYREIDGVVFDLDSYARHCKPPEQEKKCEDTPKADENPAETPSVAPAPVFAVDPYPDGWYPAEDGRHGADDQPPGCGVGRAAVHPPGGGPNRSM